MSDRWKHGLIRLVLALGCLSGDVDAHSDPWGDVYPEVAVRDGLFVVSFTTTLPNDGVSAPVGRPASRMVFSGDGKLLFPRHRVPRDLVSWEGISMAGGVKRIIQDGRTYRISGMTRGGGEVEIVEKHADGSWGELELPWPKSGAGMDHLHDAAVAAGGFALVGPTREQRRPTPLAFVWFPEAGKADPVVLEPGAAFDVYGRPSASGLVFGGGRFWLAFVGLSDGEWPAAVKLWSWKPGERAGRCETIAETWSTDSHLSLAAIGGQLCLAYHGVGPESPNWSSIKVVFRRFE